MTYVAPIKDMQFVLHELAGLKQIQALPGCEDATDETVAAVLEENARFIGEVVAPLNRAGDVQPARWNEGRVTTSPGFKEAFRAFVEAGWQGVQHPAEFGGQGLPKVVAAPCMEMLQSASLSFAYGWLIAPLLRHRERAVRAIGTLGFALFILGCTGLIWSETVPRRLTLPTDQMYAMIFSVRVTYTRLLALLLAVVMVGATALLLNRTRLGLSMRALAADRNVSSLIGIRVVRVDAIAWLISGVFAGVAGLLLADLVALNATFLTFLVIPAIAAAIFGRLQSLAATAIGGLVAGITEALLITVVRDKKGEGHAVLTVKTDKGEFILDNQNETVVAWTETGYRFVKRQSQGDPNQWVSLGDNRPAVATASAH